MEHEDNSQMENVQIASGLSYEVGGFGVGNEIVDSIGSNLGGKFEHDDDEESKYVKEVQQSEKQTIQHKANNDSVTAAKEEIGNGGAAADLLAEDERHYQHENDEVGNGRIAFASKTDVDFMVNEEEDVEIMKNNGYSSTTTSKAEKDIDVVEMEIKEIQQLPHEQQQQFSVEMEEELSSLATNTTNGTNSISENASLAQQRMELNFDSFENKENNDPLQANDFDSDAHSQLNPNAREFVPNLGSNPASPTSAVAAASFAETNLTAKIDETTLFCLQPHPDTLPRHLFTNDDEFVAESPRKGRCSDMEAISLPAETEFEHEAAKRPHELEQEDDLIADGVLQQQKNLPLDELENGKKHEFDLLNTFTSKEEFLNQSVGSLIDHGPETSVDQEIDNDNQQKDIMRQSIYAEQSNQTIEDLLNTVQPLPNDAETLNYSDDENIENGVAGGVAAKELRIVEEKEHVSQSPSIEELQNNIINQILNTNQEIVSHSQSTEEMQRNVEHDIHGSAKDIPQLPIDMDNSEHMHSSFYIQNAATEIKQQIQNTATDLLNMGGDSTAPHDTKETISETSELQNGNETADVTPSKDSLIVVDCSREQQIDNLANLVQFSTEEKHLQEDTKEFNSFDIFERKNDDLQVRANDDGHLIQEKDTIIAQNANPFFVQESIEIDDQTKKDEIIQERQHLLQFEQETPISIKATNETGTQFNEAPKIETKLVDEPTLVESAIDENKINVAAATAVVATAAATAIGIGTAAKTAKRTGAVKKTSTGKPLTSSNKAKESDSKNINAIKTAATSTLVSAKPRPATAKNTTATAAVKISTTTTTKKTNLSKPVSGNPLSTIVSKPNVASKTVSAPRLPKSTAPATTATGIKSRPATAPNKPTTLALPAAPKPKPTSPRSNLTTQLRKTGAPITASSVAKSPTKAINTNGLTSRPATAAPTNRTTAATTITTTTNTTANKQFTARPAPKTTSSTIVTSTNRRLTTKTNTTGKISTVTLKKSPTNKPLTSTSVGSKLSPNLNAASKLKTKDTKAKDIIENGGGGASMQEQLSPAVEAALIDA